MTRLSVVIPLGPQETRIGRLCGDLLLLPADTEILLVGCDNVEQAALRRAFERRLSGRDLRWLQTAPGRARQQNCGARAARGTWLWFVHWDSGFDACLVERLGAQWQRHPDALHYCRLRFMPDGQPWMGLNAWGANLRSRWLGVPFGDQGFGLSAALFRRLGGFDETASYGEDHLLVWHARRLGVALKGCAQPLLTSARKYRQQGWGRLTLRYQWLWLRQALPHWWGLCRGRVGESG